MFGSRKRSNNKEGGTKGKHASQVDVSKGAGGASREEEVLVYDAQAAAEAERGMGLVRRVQSFYYYYY